MLKYRIHVLDIHTILEDSLQVGQPHRLLSDQPSFQKLLTFAFRLDLNTSPNPVLHVVIHTTKSQNVTFLGETTEHEDEQDLYVALPEEYIPSSSF